MTRRNSFGFCGGAFGDEGKGRIVDEYVFAAARKGKVVVYRDNGGANAGHTVEFAGGKRVALHQIPSGVFHSQATVILGKGMVIHPGDLLEEIRQVQEITGGVLPAELLVDEQAVLSLDTHRAFESVLKQWEEGGKGSTGRGISPAYSDVILRHPLRARDLVNFDEEKVTRHYQLYAAMVKGLGATLAKTTVPSLRQSEPLPVGTQEEFVERLQTEAKMLRSYIQDVHQLLTKTWKSNKITFVFEKAQAIGLDARWGVYPDITASDCTFSGIEASTEGIVRPDDIDIRAAVIKATYMSTVGTRKLPTVMPEKEAGRIREDAHEYGATTKRPRGIAYIDIPAIQFYMQVGNVNAVVLTHMDIVYSKTPIKVCVGYTQKGKPVAYRPDQLFLNTVKPIYKEFKPWNSEEIRKAKNTQALPKEALTYLRFLSKQLGLPISLITTGPQRNQGISFPRGFFKK